MTTSPEDFSRLPTEQPNPRAAGLDRLSTEEMLRVINAEDRRIAEAVEAEIPRIAAVVDRAARAFRQGGRLHYFGAGTSGRLGVLDASEMPPTFGVDAALVQGHMAGGNDAIIVAREGAEDDPELGARDVDAAGVTSRDVVVALSASGRAPYCIGVLSRAAAIGAFRAGITCNPRSALRPAADVVIAPDVGPEVLAGSTRMKAGTAQKLVLNMISTGAMVRYGLTYGHLMVGVAATNSKLRDRARRLVGAITGKTEGTEEALAACGWDVRRACVAILKGLSPEEAAARLQRCEGSLRRALE